MADADDRDEDLGMQIYRIFGEVLVNQDAAIGFARLLLQTRFGAEELAHQEPLTITDSGTYWTILGSGKPVFEGAQPCTLAKGRAEIEISKFDGRLWKFAINGHFVQPSKD